MMRTLTVMTVSALLTAIVATTPVAAQEDAEVVAVVNVSVVPMETDRVIDEAIVVIEGGRIAAVGPASEVSVPDGAQVIDGRGGYVIPGLADMHYHADGEPNNLVLAVANGITTIQNLNAGSKGPDAALAAEVAAGERLGPRMVNGFHAAGLPDEIRFAFDRINRALEPWLSLHDHIDNLDVGPPLGFAADAVGAQRFVANALEAETGFFKTNLFVSRDGFDVIVEAAADNDLTVQGHVSGAIGLEHYLESGAHPHHLTEIAPYLSSGAVQGVPFQKWDFAVIDEQLPALVQLMVDNGTWFTPTLNLLWYLDRNLNDLDALQQRPETRYLSLSEQRPLRDPDTNFVVEFFGSEPDADEIGARYLEAQERIVRALHDAGVPLLAGTDASAAPGSIRGFDLHLELELLVGYGLSPFEALQAATSRAAEFRGEADEWGTVTVGSRADLVLLGSNPLANITATRDIAGVMVAGSWYPDNELQAMLDEIATEYERLAAITMIPFTSTELGIAGLAPTEWTVLEPGVWTRSDPDTDPTFLIQQAAPAAAAGELTAGILENFAVTELGPAVDTVTIDELTWEIFAPEAELGLLVARSEVASKAVVVALAALPSELDELAELVLRPALSSLQETPT